MKKALVFLSMLFLSLGLSAQSNVYFTSEITPESLVHIFQALGVNPSGAVAVKISTGESAKSNYLRPEFIEGLVNYTGASIVECNTAYGGIRDLTSTHLQVIAERGFDQIAKVDIMDADGEVQIPVEDTTWIKYDIVGSHLISYDFMINLAHFKGHARGGYGGVLKNQSIGMASRHGKCYIHTAGQTTGNIYGNNTQDSFLESMAAAAQAVQKPDRLGKGNGYIQDHDIRPEAEDPVFWLVTGHLVDFELRRTVFDQNPFDGVHFALIIPIDQA